MKLVIDRRILRHSGWKWLVLSIGLLFLGTGSAQGQRPSVPKIAFLLTDFTDCQRSAAPVLSYGSFYTPGQGFAIETCLKDPLDPNSHAEVLRVKYDVSLKGSFAGFWTQWKSDSFDPDRFEALRMDIRGDSEQGFATSLKVELKIKEKGWGWRANQLVDITDGWETVVIPLDHFNVYIGEWEKDVNEFVLTFINGDVDQDQGRIYIDNVGFTAIKQGGG